jgi:hypothetical protein
VRLVASRGASVLDSVDITVIGQKIAAVTVLDALDGMRLRITPNQARILRGSVDVLSLLRRGESQRRG